MSHPPITVRRGEQANDRDATGCADVLIVHRASRGDWLIAGLAELLAAPVTDDAFAPEVVAVPTRGVERWLSQRLSTVLGTGAGGGDGVCANVEFPFPGSLVGGAMAAATGVDAATDPWAPNRAIWPLLEVVDASMDQPWLEILATHLGAGGPDPDEARRARRFSTLRHLADLYDHYGIHRPAMIRAWAAGDDVDAIGGGLPADVAWQAQLWRALRAALGVPSPAERLETACRRLAAEPGLIDQPSRLSLFGLTRLPASYLDVLSAIGTHRDVHLWLLHPSPTLWSSLAPMIDATTALPLREDDPTREAVRNPLLATWGRDAREMQVVLADGRATTSVALPEGDHPETLLGHVQADVRANLDPPGGNPFSNATDTRPLLESDDRSLQVHACHGRARQVEVLRDAILHTLADDPTLQPRDVIVMCPDIDSFAPLIQATFGSGVTASNGQDLHVRLADRSIRQTNPVLGAVAHLLDLAADGRVTASSVLDLAGTGPVRTRFGFDDDDVERIEKWARTAGVRWGLDAAGREPYHLGAVAAGTWRAGLDRILLGVVMSEDDLRQVGATLPYDDIASGDVELVGRFAELIGRLGTVLRAFEGEHPLGTWVTTIADAARDLMATGPADAWQHNQLQATLNAVLAEAGDSLDPGGGAPLSLTEIRAVLADRLRGRPTRANFRTGHLTMCTLVPMRSVPHKVVGLLGLDDGVFPRRTSPDGDDLLARQPIVGDRSPRAEDRQLLLDALLAAKQHLIITYKGRDERSNAVCPPAVPVGELLDVIDRTVRTSDGTPARDKVVVHHPLQPFDTRNFEAGKLVPPWPWSFDPIARAGAEASVLPRSTLDAFGAEPLPAQTSDLVALEDLINFVQHPAKAFLRQRLGVYAASDWPEPGDDLPIQLDPLDAWTIGDRLLEMRLAGVDAGACGAAEAVRGGLPPGPLGQKQLEALMPTVELLVAEAGPGVPRWVDVDVTLGDRSIVGTIGDVVDCELRTVTYSRLAPKHRLTAWVRLLAITAARPQHPWQARSIGRDGNGSSATSIIGPLASDPTERRRLATSQLTKLVALYDRGLRGPLPLACDASAAWAEAPNREQARADAEDAWEAGRYPGKNAQPDHRLALGAVFPLDALLAPLAGAEESGPGWAEDEPTQFGRLAHYLWDDLLSLEDLT
jgi:exodeoxyribonuclease V gamma subunit